MRVDAYATSLSWIPSESVSGWLRASFELGVSHYDEPPVDRVVGADAVAHLRADDRFRFANVLHAWAEFDEERPVEWGYAADSGLVMGATTVRVASVGATFAGYALPDLRPEPAVTGDAVTFGQTVGGRTGVPLPRPVPHPPFVLWQAPIVWTTLRLTLRAGRPAEVDLPGASAFPRHWVYGPDGALLLKSGLTDQKGWMDHSFGPRTPWGEQDAPALVVAAESELERRMSHDLMRGERPPQIRTVPAGDVVTRQGEPGAELFLLLDGILAVDVDGTRVADVGPGAMLGERAVLEGGRRTSTLTAVTPVRLAVAPAEAVDVERLRALAALHRREE
ncbi:cyclic nucleotide-binding domain-containing protein [Georgenia faecalis]|uniref:Cyclic nucleotide-binding domain-containing protein n=1 Tax=Georgenia faecalis TaxID=2483799 RepID=A0ABV9DB77_9MICO|nr:cyclic nucleotide-binding domain-containing protein [Georgenia faecalis]